MKKAALQRRHFRGWLPHQDSNLEKRYQKPVCYHYTMGQSRLGDAKINKEK